MKKRVLIGIPNLGICNGVTTFIMSFYDYLLNQGYAVDFLLVMDNHSELESYVLDRGSNIYMVPNYSKYDKRRVSYIDNVFYENNYDIVHVNFPGPNGAMVLKSAKKNGVKYRIYHCHNPLNVLSIKSILSEKIFTPLCKRRANKYVACTNMAGKSIFGNAKFEVINNAINPRDFLFSEEARVRIRKDFNIENQLVVGVAARMDDQKNPDFIIDVFCEIRKINPGAKLLWVGDGRKQNQIQAICAERDIKESVLLVGRQSNVRDWYSAMDVFLLPSKFEGLGIVYLEAQANGLLCFGSDRVPEETEVTNLMHRISLDKTAAEWAAEILETYESSQKKREVDIDLFKEKGYDSRFVESRLYDVYESFFENNHLD